MSWLNATCRGQRDNVAAAPPVHSLTAEGVDPGRWKDREAMVLTGIEGFDYREAGALLGVRDSTVRSLVAQARARFAEETDTDE
jgi:predicted DNA-binding protein (UPF0251 family)